MKKVVKILGFLTITIYLTLFLGCNSNDIDQLFERVDILESELENVKMVNNILELKNTLLEAKLNEILIESTQAIDSDFEIKFEDDKIVLVTTGIVNSIDADSTNWMITFNFSDNTEVETYFIGKQLIIPPSAIRLNPNNISPLSALGEFMTPVNSKIKIRIIGQDGGESDITHILEYYGKEHNIDIYGLYPDFDNQIEIEVLNKNDKFRSKSTVEIITQPLPGSIPTFEIVKPYANIEANTVFLIDYRPYNIPIMVDKFGKVRWYSTGFSETSKYALQLLKNGNIGFGRSGNGQGSIFEYTMMGKLIKEYSFYPQYENAHHDVFEMKSGNFLVAVNKTGESTIEDYIIEVDRNSGAVSKVWDLNTVLPKRYDFIHDEVDWVHVNAVIHDERDNSLIISGQRQGIFKVSWNNELKWIFAPNEGWAGYEDYLLTNNNVNFEWIWGQHAPEIMPNGNLFLFDNGFGRGYGTSPKFSRAVEFKIEEAVVGGNVDKVWEYGTSRGEELFSPIISDVDFLSESGTRFITFGSLAFESTYNSNVSISGSWSTQTEKARLIEVDENQNILFEMIVKGSQPNGSVYRSEKLKIYN